MKSFITCKPDHGFYMQYQTGITGTSLPEPPRDLHRAVRASQHLTVLSGAGMSAESGVPTFRDALTGLWERYSPEELATPEAFARQPETVWQWYAWRRELIARAEPHAGHRALVEMAENVARFDLVTQNVDGLHQRAGSRDVVEFHGSLQRDRCSQCDREFPAADTPEPPRCPECDALCRPAVVWFGETIPELALRAADAACNADLMLVVGTAATVYPAAGLIDIARSRGAAIAVINTETTALDQLADWCWHAPASTLGMLL